MATATHYGDDRNSLILRELEDCHAFAISLPGALPGVLPGAAEREITIGHWPVRSADPAFELHAQDLATFLAKMSSPAATAGTGVVTLERRDGDGFDVDVERDRVTLRASDVPLMWRAVAWLERTMAVRHAPVLPLGSRTIVPRFRGRITTSMFSHGFEDPADPLAYTDDYLRHMAHLGYNRFFIYVNLWHFCDSKVLPELSNPQAQEKRAQLNALAQRAATFGLGIVLMVNAPRLDAEHPVFARLPQLKGGIVMRKTGHALCTSEPLTHRFYAEQTAALAPGMAALSFLIGGEGFLHCYTRPVPRTERVTNCTRCGQRRPAQVLTPLLNAITEAVKAASPETDVMFWPYSSYIWQTRPATEYDWSEDRAIIANLDRRASWIVEIDKDHVYEVPGIGRASVSDYSLQCIGPSHVMKLVEPALQSAGVEMVVKTETNIDAGFHSVPYIPAMQRWVQRWRAILATGAKVTWDTWRFNGLHESPSVEVAFWLDLEPELSDQEVLLRIATRIYGPAAAPRVVEGWQAFSNAWETVHRIYGPYWHGPMVIGPAHLFDRGEAFLIPWLYGPGFFEVMAGLRESETPEFLADPRHLSPRFITSPLPHVPERLRDLGRAATLAKRGVDLIEAALADVPAALTKTARADADAAAITWINLEEDVATHRFLHLRDQARYLSVSDPRRRQLTDQVLPILEGSLDRARLALAMTERTPMIGWGYTFGVRFTAAMVREKIERTTALISQLRTGLL